MFNLVKNSNILFLQQLLKVLSYEKLEFFMRNKCYISTDLKK